METQEHARNQRRSSLSVTRVQQRAGELSQRKCRRRRTVATSPSHRMVARTINVVRSFDRDQNNRFPSRMASFMMADKRTIGSILARAPVPGPFSGTKA